VQQPGATVPRPAATVGFLVAPLAPHLIIKQKLDWAVQETAVNRYRAPRAEQYFTAPLAPNLVVQQRLDWYAQPKEILRYTTPRAEQYYAEPLAPHLIIPQRLDWLVEQPGPVNYILRAGETVFVIPPAVADVPFLSGIQALWFEAVQPNFGGFDAVQE